VDFQAERGNNWRAIDESVLPMHLTRHPLPPLISLLFSPAARARGDAKVGGEVEFNLAVTLSP